ncbi:uncharacterized protein N7459_009490 [Penicillium hispanicum]|uniref:uncharacterized protein n=1 Tax=Penicillium hispanicum TaxID=1080232 RepID=UPI0025404326|nr:uncharacterized protein N7459_009490 [Penicillium hispanicum]KAJ5570060.1 hypothetical protein N7459_009490 [Penicillium hispanicum]
MALSQQHSFDNAIFPVSQTRTGSIERKQAYTLDQPNMTGSYSHYELQVPQHGGYQDQHNDLGWSQLVLEEMKDLLLLLNAEGRIAYASPSAKQIIGRVPKQLEGNSLDKHIHDDDKYVFMRDMDDSVASNRPFRSHVRLQKTNGAYCLVEIYGHPHIANLKENQEESTSTQDRCTGFFLMCRPYPLKNSQLLDSFLEHKIENARLVQQIAKLKQEEEEDASLNRGAFQKRDTDKLMVDNSTGQGGQSDQESTETVAANSDESDTSQSVDYFSEKAPHTERMSHIDGIEVMTGLCYGEGERSQGLSTGVRHGRLVQCDIDITTAADQARNVQEGDRRKRLKAQHVCDDCGTADSPEWRKGPNGPKTLCNACGCKSSFSFPFCNIQANLLHLSSTLV